MKYMSEGVLVSVVIPTYNRPHLTTKTIQSALKQDLNSFEIIVVDDGSTDETWEKISQIEDKRLRAYRHEENRGANAARNTAIYQARGKYIAFLDSDDIWDPSKIRKQATFLQHSSYDAVYCDIERTYDSIFRSVKYYLGTRLINTEDKKPEGGKELVPFILSGRLSLGGSSTLMISKRLLENIGLFDEKLQRHQDWDLMVRVANSGTVGYLDEQLVKKHDTPTPGYDTYHEAKKQFLEKHAKLVVEMELEGVNIIGEHHFGLARLAIEEKQYSRAKHHLSLARATHPTRYLFLFQAFLRGLIRI